MHARQMKRVVPDFISSHFGRSAGAAHVGYREPQSAQAFRLSVGGRHETDHAAIGKLDARIMPAATHRQL